MPPLPPLALQHLMEGAFVGCREIHSYSCERHALSHSLRMLLLALKVYIPVHVLPMLLRSKQLRRRPGQLAFRCVKGVAKSCLFVAVYSGIIRYAMCRLGQMTGSAGRWTLCICVLLGSLAIVIETPRRRTELALFLLPRALEAAWSLVRRGQGLRNIQGADQWLFAGAMGALLLFYQNEPQLIKTNYLSVFRFLFGDN